MLRLGDADFEYLPDIKRMIESKTVQFKGGGGNSSSSSSQATTSETTSEDVSNPGNGVAIGAGATYVNTFNPDVASTIQDAIDGVFNFGGNLVNNLTSVADNAINSNTGVSEAAINAGSTAASNSNATASEALNNAQLGQSSIFTNPTVVFGIVAVIGIFAFLIINKK